MLGFVPKAARPPLFNPLSLAEADAMLAMQDGVSPELRRLLQRFDRLFRLRSDDAPGLMCIGGVIPLAMAEQRAMGAPSLSVTGNGETMAGALISCLGEAADLLSPFEQPGDTAAAGGAPVLLEGWLGEAAARAAAEALPLAYTRGYDAADGRPVLLPADLCLRRAPEHRAINPPGPLSAGVAAGRSFAAAAERAMLELIERDAACLWWLGGRQAAGMAAGIEAAALLERLRQGGTGRVTRLLDLGCDLGIPVTLAYSTSPGGFGLACGIAARLSQAAAARAALLEMAQMEMAAAVAAMKQAERGDGALNAADWRHLKRSAAQLQSLQRFQAVPSDAGDAAGLPAGADLAAHLAGCGIRIYLKDLTRPDIGIPVARAIAPALQPFSDQVTTPRLAAARAEGSGDPPPDVSLY